MCRKFALAQLAESTAQEQQETTTRDRARLIHACREFLDGVHGLGPTQSREVGRRGSEVGVATADGLRVRPREVGRDVGIETQAKRRASHAGVIRLERVRLLAEVAVRGDLLERLVQLRQLAMADGVHLDPPGEQVVVKGSTRLDLSVDERELAQRRPIEAARTRPHAHGFSAPRASRHGATQATTSLGQAAGRALPDRLVTLRRLPRWREARVAPGAVEVGKGREEGSHARLVAVLTGGEVQRPNLPRRHGHDAREAHNVGVVDLLPVLTEDGPVIPVSAQHQARGHRAAGLGLRPDARELPELTTRPRADVEQERAQLLTLRRDQRQRLDEAPDVRGLRQVEQTRARLHLIPSRGQVTHIEHVGLPPQRPDLGFARVVHAERKHGLVNRRPGSLDHRAHTRRAHLLGDALEQCARHASPHATWARRGVAEQVEERVELLPSANHAVAVAVGTLETGASEAGIQGDGLSAEFVSRSQVLERLAVDALVRHSPLSTRRTRSCGQRSRGELRSAPWPRARPCSRRPWARTARAARGSDATCARRVGRA